MVVSDSLRKLIADITSSYSKIEQKGGTIPSEKNTNNLGSAIDSIPTKENVTWHQCPQLVKDYLEKVVYNPDDYSYSYITEYAPDPAIISNTKPIGKVVGGVTYYNEVPNKETLFMNNSAIGTLEPLDRLRWLNTVNPNVRDLGGWACDGGKVKYGMLIRGGEKATQSASDIETNREVLVNQVGVRRELNLRGSESSNATSLLGDEIYFYRPPTFSQYTLNNPYIYQILKFVIDGIIHNEPVYLHCLWGADRTGTLAVILEAILGIDQSDIDKDYELSMFSTRTIERTRNNSSNYKKLIDEIELLEGETFRNKIILYALSKGITVAEINNYRQAMIEGTPETFYSVTNDLEHCSSNNNKSIVFDNQYSANIVADTGYTLNGAEVSIKMDDVDITATSYSDGTINIDEVTGDIEISVIASELQYTNQVPISTDENGNIYNGIGYKNGYRLNSSAIETVSSGAILTGFIPVKAGDVVRFSGEFIGHESGGENSYFFDANKSNHSHRMSPYNWKQKIDVEQFEPYEYNDTTYVLSSFTVPNDTSIAYVRFTLHGETGANAIITVNEEI